MNLPPTITSEAQLDELLSAPSPAAVAAMGTLSGDLLLLGVAGKMGPTLARMAKRASDAAGCPRRIIGVSRFTSGTQESFHAHGIETLRCNLLDEDEVHRLPNAPNVLFMTGMKFGSTGNEAMTWAMNSYLPGLICRKYRHSRIVAFSTGNVYGLTPIDAGGSREEDVLQPIGEYAMSCVGRERVFEHFSRTYHIPMAILRLNYACELRYGVLVDLAARVWAEEPIDLSMGYFNTIWQGDANAMTLAAFDHLTTPPWIVNVTGDERLSVRAVAELFGQRMGKPVCFTETESTTALLSDARRGLERLGTPRVTTPQLMEWIADWVMRGGRSLGKPTHFESREGRF